MTLSRRFLVQGPLSGAILVTLSTLFSVFIGSTLLSQFPFVLRVIPGSLEETTQEIAGLVELMEVIPAETRPLAAEAFATPMRDATLMASFPEQSDADESMVRMLRAAQPGSILSAREMQVRKLAIADMRPRLENNTDLRLHALAANELSIRLSDGEVLVIWISPLGMIGRNGLPAVFIIAILLFIISGASTLGLRYAVTNLQALETSVTDFRPGSGASLVEESGPAEVRRLTKAMNAMQLRIDQLIRERSFLVAGVAHDIRTNITRMRLRIDQLRSPKKAALEADMAQTEQLVDDLMVYARADRPDCVSELIALGDLVRDLVEEQAFDLQLSGCDSEFVIAADRAALVRAVSNLINNAWKYGHAVHVRCGLKDGGYQILVEDEGPGIPADQLDKAMDPFYRVEPSRNPETGGTGLGLTIARDLIAAQGGELRLENRAEGGLRAIVSFPPECRIE